MAVEQKSDSQAAGGPAGAVAPEPPPKHLLTNQSPAVVLVAGDGLTLRLPPLGAHELDEDTVPRFDLVTLRHSDLVRVESDEFHGIDGVPEVVLGLAIWVYVIGVILVAINTDGWGPPAAWTVVCALGTFGVTRLVQSQRRLAERFSNLSALTLALLVGFGLPLVVLVFGAGIYRTLQPDLHQALSPPISAVLMYRMVQWVFIGVAATFPALLFFIFDRQSLDTLRNQFLHALFRLDPAINTATDWEARYGEQMRGVFGDVGGRGSRRSVLRKRNSPIVIATVVLAIGWAVAFLNSHSLQFDTANDITNSPLALLVPERNAVAYGFLGAYFFTVQTVLRSYMRADLRPKAYSQITARVLIVVLLASLVEVTQVADNAGVLALAFFAGVVPDTVLQWLWEKLRKIGDFAAADDEGIVDRQPLTDLDGIDIYDRARLTEEGVTNVESMAHGDLVDLMLQTRIPPGRLVDWVDQAVLRVQIDDDTLIAQLHSAGVRTATDLLTVTASRDRSTQLLTAIGVADDPAAVARLGVLRAALLDAEWVPELVHWRAPPLRPERTIDAIPADRRVAGGGGPDGSRADGRGDGPADAQARGIATFVAAAHARLGESVAEQAMADQAMAEQAMADRGAERRALTPRPTAALDLTATSTSTSAGGGPDGPDRRQGERRGSERRDGEPVVEDLVAGERRAAPRRLAERRSR